MSQCGCQIESQGGYPSGLPLQIQIVFCPLHREAGRLLEAAKKLHTTLNQDIMEDQLNGDIGKALMILNEAITAAEKEA